MVIKDHQFCSDHKQPKRKDFKLVSPFKSKLVQSSPLKKIFYGIKWKKKLAEHKFIRKYHNGIDCIDCSRNCLWTIFLFLGMKGFDSSWSSCSRTVSRMLIYEYATSASSYPLKDIIYVEIRSESETPLYSIPRYMNYGDTNVVYVETP
uniref:Uncharacterized protein n=1 Tax=Vespula pensylvanica TaxID=30213 RepID=A0A834PF11_VESPE|nr:hypothetical protein H0235_000853 [Vespula pensylvanica]